MATAVINKTGTFTINHTVTSEQVIHLVLLYLEMHPEVKPEDLNVVYMRNIVKGFLAEKGYAFIATLSPKLLLKKQDLMVHLRGMFEK